MISDADVAHVARLARLALTDAECQRMREQLDGILAYIDTLRALDTSATEPTSHAVPLVNAPERSGEFFRVPRIIEEGPGEPS